MISSMIPLVWFGAGHSPFYRLSSAPPTVSGTCRRTGTSSSVFALPGLTTERSYTFITPDFLDIHARVYVYYIFPIWRSRVVPQNGIMTAILAEADHSSTCIGKRGRHGFWHQEKERWPRTLGPSKTSGPVLSRNVEPLEAVGLTTTPRVFIH